MEKQEGGNILLDSLIRGDEQGVLKIYELFYPKIRQYILQNGGEIDHAKDIMQNALLQLMLRARDADFKIQSSFEAYLFTICRNLWRREKRIELERVTNERSLTLLNKQTDLIEATIEQEKWELFQEKLSLISKNCQELLKFHFEKINYIEIAKRLSYANENVVRQRIFKCKKKLKEEITSDKKYKEIRGL